MELRTQQMIMKRIAVTGSILFAFGALAFCSAGQPPDQHTGGNTLGPADRLTELEDTGKVIFKLADENGDGQISQKEAIDAGNLVVGGFFFRADQNGDGVLSAEEARNAREAFLSSKPWLRYALDTAKTAKPAAGSTKAQGSNLINMVASTFDTNNDKQLQATELRQAVQSVVQAEFALADTNRDGQISPSELNAAVIGLSRQVAQAAFQQADADNNGQISQAEFDKAVIEPARVAFKVIDLNHDGQISQQEANTASQVVINKVRNLTASPNQIQSQGNQFLGSPAPAGTTPAPAAPSPGTPAAPTTPPPAR